MDTSHYMQRVGSFKSFLDTNYLLSKFLLEHPTVMKIALHVIRRAACTLNTDEDYYCVSVIAATAISPIELVRTKMQSEQLSYSQVGRAMRHSVRQGGLQALLTGLMATLLRDVPFSGESQRRPSRLS